MPKIAPTRPRASDKQRTFIIVASQFNAPYVEGLVDHATEELRALAPNASVAIERVPGAFEIPVVVRELALQEKADAVIACGVILKGKTDHAQNLSRCRLPLQRFVELAGALFKFAFQAGRRGPRLRALRCAGAPRRPSGIAAARR